MRRDLQMEMMPVASLTPYAANARMHPTEQVAQLAASIAEFGFRACLFQVATYPEFRR